jgi:hypothetical protein
MALVKDDYESAGKHSAAISLLKAFAWINLAGGIAGAFYSWLNLAKMSEYIPPTFGKHGETITNAQYISQSNPMAVVIGIGFLLEGLFAFALILAICSICENLISIRINTKRLVKKFSKGLAAIDGEKDGH